MSSILSKKACKSLIETEIYTDMSKNYNREEVQILDDATIGKEWGYIFFYQSIKYIKSGDFRDMLAGNAPYIINKHNGEIIVTGTTHDLDFYIEEYEKNLEADLF